MPAPDQGCFDHTSIIKTLCERWDLEHQRPKKTNAYIAFGDQAKPRVPASEMLACSRVRVMA